MKRLILWLFVVIISGCCVNSSSPSRAKAPTTRMQSLTAKLFAQTVGLITAGETPTTHHVYCAGTWITQDTFLTAKHCTEDANDGDLVFIEYEGGKPDELKTVHAGKLIDVDPDHDLSLVRAITHGEHEVATLSLEQFEAGDGVHIVGHPFGLSWTYMRGFISAVRSNFMGPMGAQQLTQISAPITYGSSGGGAFDESGRLIGVASFIRKQGPNLGFFTHRDSISEFLLASSVSPD